MEESRKSRYLVTKLQQNLNSRDQDLQKLTSGGCFRTLTCITTADTFWKGQRYDVFSVDSKLEEGVELTAGSFKCKHSKHTLLDAICDWTTSFEPADAISQLHASQSGLSWCNLGQCSSCLLHFIILTGYVSCTHSDTYSSSYFTGYLHMWVSWLTRKQMQVHKPPAPCPCM